MMKEHLPKEISKKKITLLYAIIQGGYWSSFCATYGFATVFLLSRGFTTSQIGISIALANVLAVVCQPTVATIADEARKISLHSLTILLIVADFILFGLLFFTGNFFIATMALFVLTNTVSQTVQPLINSISFYYINRGVDMNFGLPRSMGSMSYAIVSTIIGYLVEDYGSNVILIFGVVIFAIIGITVAVMPRVVKTNSTVQEETFDADDSASGEKKVGEAEAKGSSVTGSKKESIFSFFGRYKIFSVALLGSTCIFIFHFATNNYMLQIAENVGGSAATMGTALSIAAMCEIPSMMFSEQIMKKIKYNYLLVLSGLFFCVKAFVYIVAVNIPMLYVSQVLQMVSYAFFIPASVYYVNENMNDNDKVKGQAIMTGTTTLGGVIGSLIGGIIIDYLGVKTLQWVGFAFAVTGAVLFLLSAGGILEKKNKKSTCNI